MFLVSLFVVTIVLVAPTAAIYFRRSAAIASIAAVILARAACGDAAFGASLISLFCVTLVLAVETTEPGAVSTKQRATTTGNGDTRTKAAEDLGGE